MDDLREPRGLTRRGLLAGGGALIVSFSLLSRSIGQDVQQSGAGGQGGDQAKPPPLPGALADSPLLDSWIRIDADGKVTVFTGKAELGQGVKTAIRQCAAEELEIDPVAITLITADTVLTPNEGYTAGSMSMQNSGTAVRNAAAQVRELLIAKAATQFNVAPDSLRAENGKIVGGPSELPYGQLVADQMLHVNAQPQSKLKATADFKVMGKPLGRVDIPGKVTGGAAYVQDMRLPGMLHGRVIRPPSYKATLVSADVDGVAKMPGVVKVIHDGSYLAVLAEGEWQAIKAMRTLARSAKWNETPSLLDLTKLPEELQKLPHQDGTVADSKTMPMGVTKTYEAWFTRQYQMHGSIGPSCAVAQLGPDGVTTVYTHTQGVYPSTLR